MRNFFTFLLLFACSCLCYSQNITLKGVITDPDNLPLESATVYLTSAKDSTVINYTITNSNGSWEMKTWKQDNPVFLKVSFIGFADHKQKIENITEGMDFGTIKLEDRSTELDAVVVEGEVPPIRIKSDTLEFNASSFKVRPDSNVQTLLKQLPGVDIDEDGKITVNGKEVNQILVNGKPFFDKDGKIALQNLPAEIINKIQVSDTKTKKEELTGQKASGNNASINFTIDEDKNKGIFGKAMAGYGTDDRYESSAIFNYFKGERKISILASSNNINSSGFSMNEIFDSMGGGRNNSIWSSSDGSFSINGVRFGGGSGITTSNMLGINYSDELVKDVDQNISYFYTSADSENNNRTEQTNFLPATEDPNNPGTTIDPSYRTISESKSDNLQFAHNFNTQFEIKLDSTTQIYLQPKFVRANNKSTNYSSRYSTKLSDNTLLNDSEGHTMTENNNSNFTNEFIFTKAFAKKGRSIDFSFENGNQKDDGYNLNQTVTNEYSYDNGIQSTTTDNRDQVRYNRQADDKYTIAVEYREPVTDSLQAKINFNYDLQKSLADRDGFDLDPATGEYTIYNDSLSNYLSSKIKTFRPTAGFNINKDKLWVNFEAGIQAAKFGAHSSYVGQNYEVNRDYVLPYLESGISYRMQKGKSLWAWYSYNVNYPQPTQVLPVADISNPLNTYTGNPDLDPQKYHNVNISYRNYDFSTRSGYNVYVWGNYNDTDITSFRTINASAKTNTTYRNISGTYRATIGANWNKQIKKDANTYRVSVGMNANYSASKGFLNEQLYDSKTLGISPRFNFTYEYGEILTINPSYNFNYNQTNYTNYVISEASNVVHKFNLQTTSYWPKNVVFGNDFGYTYNSQLADGFKKDFFLWNMSLGYNFWNDQLLFKVKVYDLLNQNIGTSRTIDATSITDQQNTVLKRYVMFSLTYTLKKFGGKQPGGGNSIRMW
ncbi:outer membrane beta-barrel protein [Flavobacterium rhizosphaerae]|uniref:Outer membrane beta-barrel protein n=1 Tax=Flavobacterium rhizosphaerae TaxID=3163298 RepID=A0ABW8YXS7_9FLAO